MGKPKTYTNNQDFAPQSGFLSEDAMVEVLDKRPIVCVDVLLINRENRQLILPTRTLESGRGLWFIGGMLKRGQTFEQAAAAHLKRETTLEVSEDRFIYLAVNRFVWDTRAELPKQNGRVDVNFCYTLEPTEEEQLKITTSLTREEYAAEQGLQSFDRQSLVNALEKENPVKQVLLDYYDLLFAEK